LPEQSQICKRKLRGEFGYQANTEAGIHVLNGCYAYDKDFGKSTSKALLKINLDRIGKEQGGYRLNAEKKCRNIKSGRILFSPESSKWTKRAQTYCSILRFHAGKIRNKGAARNAAPKPAFVLA